MNYTIRELRADERPLLDEFLYQAIFVPEGGTPPPRSIIGKPELQVYVENFGSRPEDICFVADVEGVVAGAVWVREMNDYGHIGDGIPSFAISILPEYRGLGMGTKLMRRMLDELRSRGFEKASLAVQKANYALRMYLALGFEIIGENEEEYIMVNHLR